MLRELQLVILVFVLFILKFGNYQSAASSAPYSTIGFYGALLSVKLNQRKLAIVSQTSERGFRFRKEDETTFFFDMFVARLYTRSAL